MINRWSHPVSYASPSQIAGTQFRVHQQFTCSKFSRLFPFFGSQKKLDQGKSIVEITYKFLMEQVADRIAFWKVDADYLNFLSLIFPLAQVNCVTTNFPFLFCSSFALYKQPHLVAFGYTQLEPFCLILLRFTDLVARMSCFFSLDTKW